MRVHAVLIGLVLASAPVLDAQTPGIRQLAPFSIFSGNVRVTADAATLDESTGEVRMTGTVSVAVVRRQTVAVPVANAAGVPFPEADSVLMRVRGDFQISVGKMTLYADEADINGLTGEMLLRGNVRMTRAQ